MEVQPDFKELLALFNAHRVEYMIVGGYALAFHGAPRFTRDLDVFVKSDPENAQHILAALETFGFASLGYIGREQFIANKRATGRQKDLADLEMLRDA